MAKQTLEQDTQDIWDTVSEGGNYMHNIVRLKLQAMEENHGKDASKALYTELLESGEY